MTSVRAAVRVRWHLLLCAGSVTGWLVLCAMWPGGDAVTRASVASAWVGAALVGATLTMGPWRLLRRRPAPVSFDARRDVGVWAGAWALAHTVIGLGVHMRGRPWEYFLHRPAAGGRWVLRGDPFGLANHAGLQAALIFVLLLALSNDLSLRALGAARWKRWQRAAYVAAGLMLAHGFAYQGIEGRPRALVLTLVSVGAAVAVMQGSGIWLRRSPRTRSGGAP